MNACFHTYGEFGLKLFFEKPFLVLCLVYFSPASVFFSFVMDIFEYNEILNACFHTYAEFGLKLFFEKPFFVLCLVYFSPASAFFSFVMDIFRVQ